MKKIISPYKFDALHNVYMEINIVDGNLSISGVEAPLSNGNCLGSAGQIIMGFKEYDNRGYETLDDIKPEMLNEGWNKENLKQFFDIWDKWHLNDMRSACEHQRALGWTYEDHHGMFVDVSRKVIVIDEFDDGTANDPIQKFDQFKGHLCPTCGYSIGSAWLHEELPEDVITFLMNLPSSKTVPAWV